MTPLCFVLMPFGTRTDAAGLPIDFDAVYRDLVEPAIRAASLEPLRADQEILGGLVHKALFERLLLCEYLIADLTAANPTISYELGVRHALRPSRTILLLAEGQRAPFDLALYRFLNYALDGSGKPKDATFPGRLVERLKQSGPAAPDSPVFQMLPNLQAPVAFETAETAESLRNSADMREKLAAARRRGPAMLAQIESQLGDVTGADSATVTDLFLSYRAVKAWDRMIALVDKMAPALRSTELVQQQLALALNRAGDVERAVSVLHALLQERGPSSETYGILGRVYKDQWEKASKSGDRESATPLLDKAIEAYLRGFEADWRDFYPGLNAVTLMELRQKPDDRQKQILPVVQYCIERRLASGKPDYWDYASRLELAVLAKDEQLAALALKEALGAVREEWEPETTARNLHLIQQARQKRGEPTDWLATIEQALRDVTRASMSVE